MIYVEMKEKEPNFILSVKKYYTQTKINSISTVARKFIFDQNQTLIYIEPH